MRLPLAVPPCTPNPSIYATGLLHVAPIYITFESLWQAILDLPRLPIGPKETALQDGGQNEISVQNGERLPDATGAQAVRVPDKLYLRIHSLLHHLRLPGLLRTQRLGDDIRTLSGMSDSETQDLLDVVSRKGKLAEFITHTKKAVETNPHVLLAYAWVFYMALFSGGRYLRAALAEAGGEGAGFWVRESSLAEPFPVTKDAAARPRRSNTTKLDEHTGSRPSSRSRSQYEKGVSTSILGLQFFNFVGDVDGEDIKLDFKKRVVEAEVLLTSEEKEDIIAEAENIFNFMVGVVLQLDSVMECTSTVETLSSSTASVPPSQQDNVDSRPLGSDLSKGEPSSFMFGRGKDAKHLDSPRTKWLTSLVPMVLCILLTSWYYGL